jgi:hypothetical protein
MDTRPQLALTAGKHETEVGAGGGRHLESRDPRDPVARSTLQRDVSTHLWTERALASPQPDEIIARLRGARLRSYWSRERSDSCEVPQGDLDPHKSLEEQEKILITAARPGWIHALC